MNKINYQKYFKLYAHCFPVKGAVRSIICDLKRTPGYYLIPNSLYDILLISKTKPYIDVINSYGDDDRNTIDDYFSFLMTNEVGFWCDEEELDYFPDLSIEWDYPSDISNAIIDIAAHSGHPYSKIFNELAELHCYNIQIRSYDTISINTIRDVLQLTISKPFFYIELVMKFDREISAYEWKKLLNDYPAVCKITVHSANQDEVAYEHESGISSLFFIKQSIHSSSHCGFIHKDYFTSNIQLFTEAQSKNTCLNRKIAIDSDGNIKNCPAMTHDYGNIKAQTFKEVLEIKNFRDLWNIHKDQTIICKDCEFRYICTDCRAFLQDPENIFSKPLKCGYDPHTGKWENWQTGGLSHKAIEFYTERNIL